MSGLLRHLLMATAGLLGLAACESRQPGTRTGAALDRAGTETGQALSRAATATGEALGRAGDWIQRRTD